MNRKWLLIGGGAAVVLIALIPWPGDSARQTGESVTVYSNAMLTVVWPMPTVIPTPSIQTVAEPRKSMDKQILTPPAESAVMNLHFEVAESGPYGNRSRPSSRPHSPGASYRVCSNDLQRTKARSASATKIVSNG